MRKRSNASEEFSIDRYRVRHGLLAVSIEEGHRIAGDGLNQ